MNTISSLALSSTRTVMDAARHYSDGQQQPQQVAEWNGDDVQCLPTTMRSVVMHGSRWVSYRYATVFREETEIGLSKIAELPCWTLDIYYKTVQVYRQQFKLRSTEKKSWIESRLQKDRLV